MGLGIGGVGVASVAVASVFGVLAMGNASDGRTICPTYPNACPREGAAAYEKARSQAAISTAAFLAGGALVLGGALTYVLAPKSASPLKAQATTARVVLGTMGALEGPGPAASPASVSVHVTW